MLAPLGAGGRDVAGTDPPVPEPGYVTVEEGSTTRSYCPEKYGTAPPSEQDPG